MRGAFIIITLIALLIVGILVIKDMETESDGLNKKEVVEKAEKAAEKAEKSMDRIKDLTKKAIDY